MPKYAQLKRTLLCLLHFLPLLRGAVQIPHTQILTVTQFDMVLAGPLEGLLTPSVPNMGQAPGTPRKPVVVLKELTGEQTKNRRTSEESPLFHIYANTQDRGLIRQRLPRFRTRPEIQQRKAVV